MKILEKMTDFDKYSHGCVLTIGNFDGVHLGHQEILLAAKQTATQRSTELVVMTFEPHPLAILHPPKALGILAPLVLKKYLLAGFGVDYLFVVKSSKELLALTPEDFVEKFIVKGIQPSVVVEGKSFNFGSNRSGNIQTLKKLGAEKGFEVIVVGGKEVKLSTGQSVEVSSTMIRNLIESGNVSDAALALGRPYRLIGRIVRGQGKGKQLGFPTLNLQPSSQLIPAEGVYAGFVEIGDSDSRVCAAKEKIPAALSIGRSETLGINNPLAVEAHILSDNVGDLAGSWLAIDFIERIRSQHKFNTPQELAKQIVKDCQQAQQVLCADKVEKSKDERDYKTNI